MDIETPTGATLAIIYAFATVGAVAVGLVLAVAAFLFLQAIGVLPTVPA